MYIAPPSPSFKSGGGDVYMDAGRRKWLLIVVVTISRENIYIYFFR